MRSDQSEENFKVDGTNKNVISHFVSMKKCDRECSMRNNSISEQIKIFNHVKRICGGMHC